MMKVKKFFEQYPQLSDSLAGNTRSSPIRQRNIAFTSPCTTISLILVSSPIGSCASIIDNTLSLNGGLQNRLDRSLDHFQIPAKKKQLQSLHFGAENIREERNLSYCPACNVTLCNICCIS